MRDHLAIPERYPIEVIRVPAAEVWVCGSRTSGTGHDATDLGPVVRAPGLGPASVSHMEALRESSILIILTGGCWRSSGPASWPLSSPHIAGT